MDSSSSAVSLPLTCWQLGKICHSWIHHGLHLPQHKSLAWYRTGHLWSLTDPLSLCKVYLFFCSSSGRVLDDFWTLSRYLSVLQPVLLILSLCMALEWLRSHFCPLVYFNLLALAGWKYFSRDRPACLPSLFSEMDLVSSLLKTRVLLVIFTTFY